ncbi:MAG: UvrD-helicase domain-containing protein [Acidimicrobiales bacterium]
MLAGPGSGEARVLSSRARYQLAAIPERERLLPTFTNQAAAEMLAPENT